MLIMFIMFILLSCQKNILKMGKIWGAGCGLLDAGCGMRDGGGGLLDADASRDASSGLRNAGRMQGASLPVDEETGLGRKKR